MLRSLTLAAFLLFALLWVMMTAAMTGRPLASPQRSGPGAASAVTSTGVITVTTTEDEVNSDGDCSLREAIQAAATDSAIDGCPAGSGGDTILLSAGHYVLALGQLEITGTVILSGSVDGTTILDANKQGRVLSILPDATVALFYLDIRNGQNSIPGGYSSATSEEVVGGGVANYGTTWIDHTSIHMNRAGTWPNQYMVRGGHGGGIYNGGILTVTNSTISGNSGGDGGKALRGGLEPCVVDESWAAGEGGGIANFGTLLLENSTIASNTPGTSYCHSEGLENPKLIPGKVGGIYAGEASTTIIRNSIVASNQASDCGEIISLGHNLFQTIDGCTINGDFLLWAAMLNPLANNGGPTLTHALNQRSPAIDAGHCFDSAGITVTVDQRGEPRPQGDGCDIGAYESPFTSTFAITETNLPLISHEPVRAYRETLR